MHDYVQLLTTIDRQEAADKIARELVAQHVAACVQILGPITSVYRWKNEIQKAEEWQLIIKTPRSRADAAAESLARMHTYETPEIIILPIVGGSKAYLQWVDDETRAE